MKTWTLALVAFLASAAAGADAPNEKIDLLKDPKLSDLTAFFSESNSLSTDKAAVYSVGEDGILRVNGEGFGYLRSNAAWKDFHLVVEYRWGEHTWSKRADRARDAGVFVHCHGEDGAFYNAFPMGVEVQLIEGGSGNLNVLGSKETEARATSTLTPIDEKSGQWNPDAKAQQLLAAPKVTVFTNYRDENWTDVKGFRGAGDVEALFGEWNRLEVICERDTLEVRLNGVVVNRASGLEFGEGTVGIQSEWAEWHVRRWEIHPLGKFTENWAGEEKSNDTGSGADLLPRELPWSPEESLAALEVDGPFDIELVAAEPLVCDPVDVVWDAEGRMFVAEMRDYPLPPTHGPLLSRIRLLTDEDGDGKPDKATTWADNIDHVQGLLPMEGGILATTRTKILFFKDHDDDGFADEPEVWFQSNEPSHSQLQVSSPRQGRDNWIYLNNGLNGKEIYPGNDQDAKVEFGSRNIRIHPKTREIQVVSGHGQFGATIDDWGRRFACTNRNPVIFSVMPLDAVQRNPYAGLTLGHVDIAPFGGDSKVYPYELSHTTSNAHLGTHTSACGVGIYRGNLVPELNGDYFVCEPPGQLVTRSKLVADGASLKAEHVRIGKQTEFLRSRDEWFRPVNIRNGPDGALYVCDMYRRFIDHARFFPEEFQQAHYMRAGFDQGRIWRIVPKGGQAPKVEPLSKDPEQLLAKLSDPSGWVRDAAQRLLVERGEKDVVEALGKIARDGPTATGRMHALWTLDGLGAITGDHLLNAFKDPQAEVVENAIELADFLKVPATLLEHENARVRFAAANKIGGLDSEEVAVRITKLALNDYGDPWMRNAILGASRDRCGRIFEAFLGIQGVREPADSSRADFLIQLTAAIAARGDLGELNSVFSRLAKGGDEGNWWQLAIVDGLAQGLRRHKGDLKVTTLAQLLSKPPAELAENAKIAHAIVDRSVVIAVDREAPTERRLAAFPMLSHVSRDVALEHFSKLIEPDEPPSIRMAAFALASQLDRNKLADLLFERWPNLDPVSRGEAIKLLVGSSAIRLMKEMKAGRIHPGVVDSMSKWVWLRSTNEEMKTLAEELFTQPSADRAAVLNDYRVALEIEGDVERGRELFTVNCSVCHKVDGQGMDIGPDITDVRNKPAEALLSDILDPNRASEARWTGYAFELTDGRQLLGVIGAETADSITIKGLGVNETVTRDQIKSQTEFGLSLMPVGLEGAIDSKEKMADLLAFLRRR